MADATYGAKRAPSPDILFRTDDQGAAGHVPYHKDTDRAALLAGIAAATANLGLQSTLASIDATLKAQADIAVSLWTDNSGAFYVRRDVIDQDSGTVTVTFTNPTGTAATPGAGLRPVANEESLHTETIRYVSNVSGTGHTAGDMLERVVVMDANASPPTVVSSTWVNLTTGAVMATAPTIGNLTANPTALPAGAATATNQASIQALITTGNGLLSTIAGVASSTAPAQTVGFSLRPSATFNRPANTTAYDVGDLVANNTTAGAIVPMSFTVAASSGGKGLIRSVKIDKGGAAATFRVHFWTAAPTAANGDNGAFSTTKAGYLGFIDVVTVAFSDGASGVGLGEVPFDLSSGTDVVALLEARTGFTPTSGGTFVLDVTAWPEV